ncbi:MAG: uridine diphosphate-N-acetylglucosamine-binding protein YvcK [Candidatus Bipolaricaulia bacterium]
MNWDKFLKWLFPGLRINQWSLLGIFYGLLVVFSLVLLIGGKRIIVLYGWLTSNPFYYYLTAGVVLLGGVIGLVWEMRRLGSPVTAPLDFLDRSPSNMIWKNRLLDRGPKVVTIGGGTGMSVLLRGLKLYTSNITAIVTVMDDGGSSGRLKREMDMLPPGDIRNCLIALADDESRMSKIFQHRFENGSELEGHSLGNLIIAGAEQMEGSFDRAIEETSKLLNIRGRVIPSTLKNTSLVARLEGGEVLSGESSLSDHPRRIETLELEEEAPPYSPAIEEIRSADVIVLGPGSLFTSLIPNLLVERVGKAIEEAEGKKFYVTNIMTEPGETDGFSATDHLETLDSFFDISCLDYVVVNVGKTSQSLLNRYAREGAELVEPDFVDDNKYGIKPLLDDLVDTVELQGKKTVKHDHQRLAKLILSTLN